MGIFGKLFGTQKAVDNLLDKDEGLLVRAGGWIDGLSHTEQEKAENQLLVKEWGIRQLEALAPFKVVQRIIAFSVCFAWLFVLINVVVAAWVEASTGMQIRQAMLDLAFSDYVFWPVMAVLGLYMGGGVIPRKGQA